MHHQKEEKRVMSNDQKRDKPEDGGTQNNAGLKRRDLLLSGSSLLAASVLSSALTTSAQAQQAPAASGRPNILFIMGDDIGWFNLGSCHQGVMLDTTPNLDKLASEGMRFTDYYAEASCTAGRANFITGELPIRTGLTTVGQAGSSLGMPAEAPTIATALKAMGYTTGQFGKNHLGDRNEFLPTAHGFDEYFGYLYHLNAMEDPFWYTYPPESSMDTHLTRSKKGLLIKGLAERRRLDSDSAGQQRWAGFSAPGANSLMRLRKMCAQASLPNGGPRWARATWSIAGQRTKTIPQSTPVGARSASRGSWMKGRCRRNQSPA
jgi:hypothetical protein